MAFPFTEPVYMPHPAHFIGARDCRFHLATYVKGYIVSTVGEYLPDAPVREILAESRGITLEGRGDERLCDYMKKVGYMEIGFKRLYETMVFPGAPSDECPACPYAPTEFSELECFGYNDGGDAFRGHLALVEQYGRRVS